MSSFVPLQSTLLVFRLFGLAFAALGVLNIVKPREMTAFAVRQRRGGPVEGRIEPTAARLWVTRIVGGLMVVFGLDMAIGVFG